LKKIEILADESMADAIKQAFSHAKVGTMVLVNSLAAGPGVSQTAYFRGTKYAADVERVALRVVVSDHQVEETLRALSDAAQHFKTGEIEVAISPVEDVLTIRSTPTGVRVY
jgi:nitrogen regulatory protein P-II 1